MADLDAGTLRAIVEAGRLSTLQLERICQAYFGQALSLISGATTPDKQAEDMIAYAVQYHLTRELATGILSATVDSPAVQNLLLDGTLATPEQSGNGNSYNLLRLEGRLERIAERLDSIDRRLAAVEAAQSKPPAPPNNVDRLFVATLAVVLGLWLMWAYVNGGLR